VILVAPESSLYIELGLEQENELGHDREPSTRSLTASQVVNSSGCC
jgi:hypothetical protein